MDIDTSKPVSTLSTAVSGAERSATPAAAPVILPAAAKPQPEAQPAKPIGSDQQKTSALVAERLREFLRSSQRELEFTVDHDAETLVVRVRDASTGDVIRQFPNEEALHLMRRLHEGSGTFLDLFA